jgi:hypothetical protein
MNAFVELLMTDKAKEGWDDLSLEVHFVAAESIDIIPTWRARRVSVKPMVPAT